MLLMTPIVSFERVTAILRGLVDLAMPIADRAHCSEKVSPAVDEAKRFIQTYYAEPITPREVVGHVHISRFYFCRLFKKETGLTLSKYIAQFRLEQACELLAKQPLRVTEVAMATGFGSIPHFNRVFKSGLGMPPTRYRQLHDFTT